MHAGSAYKLKEFLYWTRHNMYRLTVVGLVPAALYQLPHFKWLAIPWTVVALLGTATAFLVGFKNTQTYNRTWEARQIWGSILNTSRAWGVMVRDFPARPTPVTRELVYRHFAWLTALRYQMREGRVWENSGKSYNQEYGRFFTVPERETPLADELAKYMEPEELQYLLSTKNRAAQVLSLQSKAVSGLREEGLIDSYQYIELERMIKELYDHQGRTERIKNFPYPRQFATINAVFIRLFCYMLPFGLLKDFDKLNESVDGFMKGHMVWLVVPFSVLISWVFTSLEQVGESTENPFEGGANDVPISQMSRTIEIDMREMLGETELPPALVPKNNIVL